MHYEITIREVTPFTEEEKKEINRSKNDMFGYSRDNYNSLNNPVHERRVLQAEVSKEEIEAVKKAIIGIM